MNSRTKLLVLQIFYIHTSLSSRCLYIHRGGVLMNFVMKCDMWTVVFSHASLNYVRSISSHSDMWVRFLSSQCCSSRVLDISYAVDWEMFEWIWAPCIETLGIVCRSDSLIVILFPFTDESSNSAMIYSDSSFSFTLRDSSGIRVDAGLPLFWCPWACNRYMLESID